MQQLGGQLHPHWLQKIHQLQKQTLVLIVEKGDGPTRTAQPACTTNLKGTKSVCCLSMYYDKNAKGVFFFPHSYKTIWHYHNGYLYLVDKLTHCRKHIKHEHLNETRNVDIKTGYLTRALQREVCPLP